MAEAPNIRTIFVIIALFLSWETLIEFLHKINNFQQQAEFLRELRLRCQLHYHLWPKSKSRNKKKHKFKWHFTKVYCHVKAFVSFFSKRMPLRSFFNTLRYCTCLIHRQDMPPQLRSHTYNKTHQQHNTYCSKRQITFSAVDINAHIQDANKFIQSMLLLRLQQSETSLFMRLCLVRLAHSTVLVLIDGTSRLPLFSGVNVGFRKKHQSQDFALQNDLTAEDVTPKCSSRSPFNLYFNLIRHLRSIGIKITPKTSQNDVPSHHQSRNITYKFLRELTVLHPSTSRHIRNSIVATFRAYCLLPAS